MSYTSNYNLNIRLSALESRINGGIPTSSTLSQVLTNGNSAGASNLNMNNNDILNCDNLQVTTINGNPIVGAQNLSSVLTIGNSATNSIALNNIGTGANVINLLPNASASNPQITLTDGTTTNTIDKNGYTTRNTGANLTHYLNFSDNSATGTGAIQKTAGISCNPSTNTITATTFVGALTGNATSATTATTATNATNVSLTSDNTAGSYYIPFAKTAGTGNKPLFIDDVTTPFTYNPNTGTLTASTFVGALTGNATTATDATNTTNVSLTSDNTNGTYYIPFAKTTGTGNKPLFIDDITTPFTYNPNTGTLTASTFVGALTGNATSATTATTATNIAGGLGGSIPYQTSVNNTALLANGTAGQVLTSNGTTLAPTWTTPAGSSNASTINTTETNTGGTYYPTFVSSAGSTQTLRVDTTTSPLSYNPNTGTMTTQSYIASGSTSTNTIASGGFTIANTNGTIGYSITGTDIQKTITLVGTIDSQVYSQSNNTYNTGNSNSGIYETRTSGTSTTLPVYDFHSTIYPTPVGDPNSSGYYYMNGSCVNMTTNYTPNSSENNYNVGVQSNNSGVVDMFLNPDTNTTTTPTILRVSDSTLTFGLGTSGTYALGNKNPSTFSSTYLTCNSSGLTIPTLVVNTTSGSPTITGKQNGVNVPLLFNSGFLQNIYGVITTSTTYQMINEQLYATTIFTANASFIVKLPSTAGLSTGAWISISFAPNSTTSRTLTIQNFSGTTLTTLVSGTTAYPAGTASTCVKLTLAPNGAWYVF